jgi:DNA-binding transcriptional LysR family regulator
MTLEQLRVFVAVAERQHLTGGARAVNLSPPAATAAIHALEDREGLKLFNRVGRRLELSADGRAFLPQARAVLTAAQDAQTALRELGGLERGRVALAASQTLASHWLPPLLIKFAQAHKGVGVRLQEGNTASVAAAVLAGEVEIGCIEGEIDEPALRVTPLAEDRLVIVGAARHALARRRGVTAAELRQSSWVMRETGSGTRAAFEQAMRAAGLEPESLDVALTLPTNEGVCAAAAESRCLTVASELVVLAYVQSGRLQRIDYALPPRRFALIRHKERFPSNAARAFETLMLAAAKELARRQSLPDYEI